MTTARLVSRALRAEWTKLWTVRRWAVGLLAAALLSGLFGLLSAHGTPDKTNQRTDPIVGPHGLGVQDNFRFVHGPLTGGRRPPAPAPPPAPRPPPAPPP